MSWLKKIPIWIQAPMIFLGPLIVFGFLFDFGEASFIAYIAFWLALALFFAYREWEKRDKIIEYFSEKHRDEYLKVMKMVEDKNENELD